jgi:hypothetical protein
VTMTCSLARRDAVSYHTHISYGQRKGEPERLAAEATSSRCCTRAARTYVAQTTRLSRVSGYLAGVVYAPGEQRTVSSSFRIVYARSDGHRPHGDGSKN